MSRRRINTILGKGRFAEIRDKALWLLRVNACLDRQLPMSIEAPVRFVGLDARQRAILHVQGGEWATQLRFQQGMILSILRACGIDEVNGLLVKNRPFEPLLAPAPADRHEPRAISDASRDLIDGCAAGVADEGLSRSLRRLARQRKSPPGQRGSG